MSRRRTASIGGGVTFVMAGAAGAAGGQLADNALWAWTCLLITLLVGGLVTGWTTWRTTDTEPPPTEDNPPSANPPAAGRVQVGDVSATDGQAVGVNYGTVTQHHANRP